MGGKGTHRQCVICGLRERHKGGRTLFFASFPTDEARCKEWVRLIGDEDLVHIPILKLRQLRHVCGDHFERRYLNNKGNRAKKHAIPKLNLTAPPLKDDQMIGFPFTMATSLPQAENNPAVQHLGGNASGSKTDEYQEQENKDGGSDKRKLQDEMGKTALTARKKILVNVSNVQTNPVPEAVASTSTSVIKQYIQYDQPSFSRYDHQLYANQNEGAEKRKPEIDSDVIPREKILKDVSNIPINILPLSVATTSTREHNLNIAHGHAVALPKRSENEKNKERQIEKSLELTSREKKLMKELRKTKCTLRALKKSAKVIENIDSEVLKDFVTSALKNQKRKPQGRRWTPRNKISTLAIYKRSPKTYRYMAHTMPLPSIKPFKIF